MTRHGSGLAYAIMRPKKVALLTAGGLAPYLNASMAGLIERYSAAAADIEIICYRGGYKGLLLGDRPSWIAWAT